MSKHVATLMNTLQYFSTVGGQFRFLSQHAKALRIWPLPIPSALVSDGGSHTSPTTVQPNYLNYLQFPGLTAEQLLLTQIPVLYYLPGKYLLTFRMSPQL